MEKLENIKIKLDSLASALLLFEDGILVHVNACGKKLLPGIGPGASVEEVLVDGAEEVRRFTGSGAMIFPVTVGGTEMNAKVSPYDQYTAVELVEDAEALSASALRSISEGLLAPLTTVMSMTPKLLPLLEDSDDPTVMARAAKLNQGVYTLLRAANHIRQAGLEKEQLVLNKKRVHVMYWLQDLTQRLQVHCQAAQRQLVTEIPSLNEMCDLDQEQMERAIMNLVSNAIKFTETDGVIRIAAAKTGKRKLRITVSDNGCGISPGEMAYLFQQKEHRAQSPDPRQGIGLGLPIARTILQAHDGTLLVESQEGVGTMVHLSIPTVRGGDLMLYSGIQSPSFSGGFDSMLMELADVLPSKSFDTRDVD